MDISPAVKWFGRVERVLGKLNGTTLESFQVENRNPRSVSTLSAPRLKTKGEPNMTRTWITSALAVVAAGTLSACTTSGNVERNAAGGAAIGALAGAVIGNNVGSGDAGAGAAIGAVVGGAAGAARGAQQDREQGFNARQYYDESARRYYYYDARTQRYYWENGELRY
jgi:phage tail tape-measure protein